jgi:hypothetical protein
MYERKRGTLDQPLATSIPFVEGRTPAAVIERLGVAREAGTHQEASVYCGRVLLAIEIEERSEKREPSPAQIAMKPKDCIDLWCVCLACRKPHLRAKSCILNFADLCAKLSIDLNEVEYPSRIAARLCRYKNQTHLRAQLSS